jgi:hypothetical protein
MKIKKKIDENKNLMIKKRIKKRSNDLYNYLYVYNIQYYYLKIIVLYVIKKNLWLCTYLNY